MMVAGYDSTNAGTAELDYYETGTSLIYDEGPPPIWTMPPMPPKNWRWFHAFDVLAAVVPLVLPVIVFPIVRWLRMVPVLTRRKDKRRMWVTA